MATADGHCTDTVTCTPSRQDGFRDVFARNNLIVECTAPAYNEA
jgi:hypothetical protein